MIRLAGTDDPRDYLVHVFQISGTVGTRDPAPVGIQIIPQFPVAVDRTPVRQVRDLPPHDLRINAGMLNVREYLDPVFPAGPGK